MSRLLHDALHCLGAQWNIDDWTFNHIRVMDSCDEFPIIMNNTLVIEINQAFVLDVTRRSLDARVDTFALDFVWSAKKEPLASCSGSADTSVASNA